MPLARDKLENDLRTIGETVVGSIEKGASGDWFAYGCMNDWRDVDLGSHKTERAAKRAVKRWVKERTDEARRTQTGDSLHASRAEKAAAQDGQSAIGEGTIRDFWRKRDDD